MYQSQISSSSLFHFTKSIDILISILKNGFYPRTAIEDISFMLPVYKKFTVGIPMVCFTDIPLVLTETHRKQYGMYGLGLSKNWGIRKGLNPIFYILKNSEAYNTFNHMQFICAHNAILIDKIKCLIISPTSNMQNDENYYYEHLNSANVMDSIMNFTAYCKLYSENPLEDVKPFYDEREWRYLPPFLDGKQIKDGTCNRLLPNQINDNEIQKLNRYMEKAYSLKFDFNDVDQIIVPKGEKDDLTQKMSEESVINYSEYEKKILEI